MLIIIIVVVVPKEHSEDRHLMPDLDRGQGAGSGEKAAALGQVLLHLTEAAAPVLPDPGRLQVLIMVTDILRLVTTIVISVNVTIRVKQIFGNISLISERLLPR